MNCGIAMSSTMQSAMQGGRSHKMNEAEHITGIPGFAFKYQRQHVGLPSPAEAVRMCRQEKPRMCRPELPSGCLPEPRRMCKPDPPRMCKPEPPRMCKPEPPRMCKPEPPRMCRQEPVPQPKRRWGEGDQPAVPSNQEPVVIGNVTTRTVNNSSTVNDLGVKETQRTDVTKKQHIYQYN